MRSRDAARPPSRGISPSADPTPRRLPPCRAQSPPLHTRPDPQGAYAAAHAPTHRSSPNLYRHTWCTAPGGAHATTQCTTRRACGAPKGAQHPPRLDPAGKTDAPPGMDGCSTRHGRMLRPAKTDAPPGKTDAHWTLTAALAVGCACCWPFGGSIAGAIAAICCCWPFGAAAYAACPLP